MTTIGDLTLNDIGATRVRTRYEDATIEGLVTHLDLDITTGNAVRELSGRVLRGPDYEVDVHLQLGRIELKGLDRNHPCEVIA